MALGHHLLLNTSGVVSFAAAQQGVANAQQGVTNAEDMVAFAIQNLKRTCFGASKYLECLLRLAKNCISSFVFHFDVFSSILYNL